jgi:hypothetical protein
MDAQLIEPDGPFGIARDHEPRIDACCLDEGPHEGRVVEAGPPAFESGGGFAFVEVLARLLHGLREQGRRRRPEQHLCDAACADRRDGASEHAVAGFGDRTEHGSRECLGGDTGVVRRASVFPCAGTGCSHGGELA